METTAGLWERPAQDVADRLIRAGLRVTLRRAYLIATGRQTEETPLKQMIAERQQLVLLEGLAPDYDALPSDLEIMGNAYIRMILLARRHPQFKSLTTLSWNAAILITRWADRDITGALDELERYAKDDDDIGPRPTNRRYKDAMQKADDAAGTASPPRPTHKLTYNLLEDRGFDGLRELLPHFEQYGFGRHPCHVVAMELPRLVLDQRSDEIDAIAAIVAQSGIRSWYLQPSAAFFLRHGLAKDEATTRALKELCSVTTDPAKAARFSNDLDASLPRKRFHMSKDVAAWQAHPKWSRLTQRAAADQGRALFKRDASAWLVAIEENGDPDNHPLNFIEYDIRYGRQNAMISIGGEIR